MPLNINKILIFSLIIILSGFKIFAQETKTLTLEGSVELALKNNPEIKMAEKELAKAKAGVWEAYSNIMPQLSASASLQHAWEIQTSTIPNFIKMMLPSELSQIIPQFANMPDYVQIAFGLQNTFRYGATLTQPLFLGGAGIAGIKMAGAAQQAAAQNLVSKKQNLIYSTANAFYSCLLTNEIVKVQEEALSQTEANLEIVAKKYNVGSASGFDKMRAEVEVANLKPQVIAARNNYKAALTQLKMILGLSRMEEIKVEGEFIYSEDDFAGMSLLQIQDLALQHRPELMALQNQKYITQKGINIARSNFLPKMFFQTDYSYLAMKDDYDIAQNDFSKGFTSAISLQIPLFTGFRNSKQYQKAKLDHNIMLDTEKQLKDGIMAEVEVSYNKYSEAKEKFIAARHSVELATEALRLANMMYKEGANTQLDVLNSQLALRQSRLNYVSSIYEYQMARYQLRKGAGLLEDVLK